MRPANTEYLKGAAFGLAAVSIWAGWSVLTRLAVTTSLDASDIAALRFGVAGLILSPVVAQRRLARDRLGWFGLAVIIVGQGAPYALVAASGLHFAPARDQGALNPGCMPLFVALITDLPRTARSPPDPAAVRRFCSSGIFPRRYCDDCRRCPLWPCSYYSWRFSGGSVWRFGAGAVGAICDTAPRGMAQRYRLDRHPPHIRRCLYRRRRAFPDLAAASEPSVAASPAPSRPFPFEKPRRPLAFT